MACGEYTVKFTLNLTDPHQMLEALNYLSRFLGEIECRVSKGSAWTLAICREALVRIWVPAASELPITPLLKVSIQSRDPGILVDIVESIKHELERLGFTGLAME